MGLIVRNTSFDDTDDEIETGSEVIIKETKENGIVVTKIGSIYQIKVEDEIKSYTYDELEKVVNN